MEGIFKNRIIVFFIALCALLFSCKNNFNQPIVYNPQVKTSDWLFLFYFDADDPNINDDLYKNIREIECAFAQTHNADGSTKEGYPSVTALVLWDGISEEKKGTDQKFIHPDGALYEIGPDFSLRHIPIEGNEYGAGDLDYGEVFAVGPNTKDLTLLARPWLKKEPDMSDPATLTNFLKWAKKHYTSSNVIVCLQDHGAGTYKETYTDSTAISRSLCIDATPVTGRSLTCKNITDALTAAGYTDADKPKILWNDLCLQATAEIVWNYKGCADYFCASPNVTYKPDYYGVFTNIKSGMTALDVGKVIVSAYFQRYYNNVADCPTSEAEAQNTRASGHSMYTSTFMSLDPQKVNALYNGVEKFSEDLLMIKESNADLFNSIYTKYLRQDIESLGNCKGLAYNGTYAWLNDLGWLCVDVADDNTLTAAHDSANDLLDLLENGDDNLIISAWGGKRALTDNQSGQWIDITTDQTYLTGKKDFISQRNVTVGENEEYYGLTIVGSVWGNEETTIINYDDWTGFSPKWGQVIMSWLQFYSQPAP